MRRRRNPSVEATLEDDRTLSEVVDESVHRRPSALLIEGLSGARRDPDSLMTVLRRPSFELAHEFAADPASAMFGGHHHADEPWRASAELVGIVVEDPDRADRATLLIDRHPRRGDPVTTGLPARGVYPVLELDGLGRVAPLGPSDVSDLLDEMWMVGEYRDRE